jgi:P27 family predicted phage terminase small subunit
MPKSPGPRPKSADVIDLDGNRSHLSAEEIARRRDSTPKPRPIRAADPPEGLSVFARECWLLHAPELDALGMLSVLDRGAFRLACESYAVARSALARMTTDDGELEVLMRDHVHGGEKRHPAYLVYDSAQRAYLRWTVEFGLTPSARIGIRPGADRPTSDEDAPGDDERAFFGA